LESKRGGGGRERTNRGGKSGNILEVSAEWEESDFTKGGVGNRGGEKTWFGEGNGNWGGGGGGGGDGTLILELLDWLLFRGAISRRYFA